MKFDTYSHQTSSSPQSAREVDIQAFKANLARLLEDEARCFGCKMLRNALWVHTLPAIPICDMHQYRRRLLAFPS